MLHHFCVARSASRTSLPHLLVRGFATKSERTTVPLTGHTLQASIKMRCDTSHACYALYWTNVNNELVVAGGYNTPEREAALKKMGHRGSYIASSEGIKLSTKGKGPVATVYNSGKPLYLPDVSDVDFMVRRKEVEKFGIKSCVWIPFEDGVLEYGTAKDGSETWTEEPVCPTVPKDAMNKAFEHHGATYVMFWQLQENGDFKAIADFVTPQRRAELYNSRGDNKTFTSESRKVSLPADGDGPVATAARTGKEQVLSHATQEPTFKRAELAKEFGIKNIHFVPVKGGVLEYGTPSHARLDGHTLNATLKMRCDNAGAEYAIYWVESDGFMVEAGTYETEAHKTKYMKKGKALGYASASSEWKLSVEGSGPVATAHKTHGEFYVQDAGGGGSTLKRVETAKDYGIKSVVMVPVEGGVLEYGTSEDWGSIAPKVPYMPKAEMKRAFDEGATYVLYWANKGEDYVATANYVLPERKLALRNARGDDKTFASESSKKKLGPDSLVYSAGKSGKEIFIEDARDDLRITRGDLAKEFGIQQIYLVPCRHGVLEWGKPAL